MIKECKITLFFILNINESCSSCFYVYIIWHEKSIDYFIKYVFVNMRIKLHLIDKVIWDNLNLFLSYLRYL